MHRVIVECIDDCQYESATEEHDVATKQARNRDRDVCCPSVLEAPLSEDQAGELARMFAALADPVRLRLLSLVAAADEVCSLRPPGAARQVPADGQSTTPRPSSEAGLIIGEKRGRGCGGTSCPSASPPCKPHSRQRIAVERPARHQLDGRALGAAGLADVRRGVGGRDRSARGPRFAAPRPPLAFA